MTNFLIKCVPLLLLLQVAIALNNSGCQDYEYVSSFEPLVNPLPAGFDASGEIMYSCRATHDNKLIPGKYTPSRGTCHVPYHNAEHEKREGVEVLTNPNDSNYQWVQSGSLPANAVGINTSQNEILYVVKCNLGVNQGQEHWLPGKYEASTGAYTGLSNSEVKCNTFEFLTCTE